MINPAAYRESIANMDAKLFHMESLMRRYPFSGHTFKLRCAYLKLLRIRIWMYIILFSQTNKHMKIDKNKVVPTRAGITDLIYEVNKDLRKTKDKNKRAYLHLIKNEFMQLKEELE